MNVVSLVILLVNVACVVVPEDIAVEVAVHHDSAGVQVMGEGVTVLVIGLLGAAVYLLVDAAIASHLLTVDARSYHMPMEMVQGIGAEAEVDLEELTTVFLKWILKFC